MLRKIFINTLSIIATTALLLFNSSSISNAEIFSQRDLEDENI